MNKRYSDIYGISRGGIPLVNSQTRPGSPTGYATRPGSPTGYATRPGSPVNLGGAPSFKKVSKKEILGKNRVIYKMKGSNKEYIKNKGLFIPVVEYKKRNRMILKQ